MGYYATLGREVKERVPAGNIGDLFDSPWGACYHSRDDRWRGSLVPDGVKRALVVLSGGGGRGGPFAIRPRGTRRSVASSALTA
jgi:hypothetical protein